MTPSEEPVYIIDTGVANVASVIAAFRRLQRESQLTQAAKDVESAAHVVLPGVGSFAAGISRLQELNLVQPLQARSQSGNATF